jgi:hypothetical protein
LKKTNAVRGVTTGINGGCAGVEMGGGGGSKVEGRGGERGGVGGWGRVGELFWRRRRALRGRGGGQLRQHQPKQVMLNSNRKHSNDCFLLGKCRVGGV